MTTESHFYNLTLTPEQVAEEWEPEELDFDELQELILREMTGGKLELTKENPVWWYQEKQLNQLEGYITSMLDGEFGDVRATMKQKEQLDDWLADLRMEYL